MELSHQRFLFSNSFWLISKKIIQMCVQMAEARHQREGQLSHSHPQLRAAGHQGHQEEQGQPQDGRNHHLRPGDRRQRLL